MKIYANRVTRHLSPAAHHGPASLREQLLWKKNRILPSLLYPFFSIAEHDIIWYGISFWLIWVSSVSHNFLSTPKLLSGVTELVGNKSIDAVEAV